MAGVMKIIHGFETLCYMHGFGKKKQVAILCIALKQHVSYLKCKTTIYTREDKLKALPNRLKILNY